jgi:septal ring factor EnvC (AmiA/AmiB activator)
MIGYLIFLTALCIILCFHASELTERLKKAKSALDAEQKRNVRESDMHVAEVQKKLEEAQKEITRLRFQSTRVNRVLEQRDRWNRRGILQIQIEPDSEPVETVEKNGPDKRWDIR